MAARTDVVTNAKLSYEETASVLSGLLGWVPGPLSRLLIRIVSKVVVPLEKGSCAGRALRGPYGDDYLSTDPLTVFAVEHDGAWMRILLAARLRKGGPLNVAAISGGRKPRRVPGRARSFEMAPLEALVFCQRRSESNLTIVPVAVASHRHTPDAPAVDATARLSRLSLPGMIRKAGSLLRTVRTGRLKTAAHLSLARWVDETGGAEPGEQAAALRVALTTAVESERRAVSGPPLKPVRQVKLQVLGDPVLASFMQRHALEEGLDPAEVLARAKEFVDEIASDYRVGVVSWFTRFVDGLFGRILTGVDVDRRGLKEIAGCDISDRIVLVCSHKSYADPLLIGYTMFRSGMVPPQQAAGLNLSFWPVGWLLRHSGAFYIRRSFAGETLYREVFHAYVRHLMADNHVIAVYAEGTRSRDGNLTRPKLGFLGVVEDSLRMGVCKDVKLVPVYLGYDRVPEAAAHVKEMAGGAKVSESVSGFAGIFKSLNTRCGRAHVRFGEAVSMKEAVRERGLEAVALEVCDRLNAITPIGARNIAAAALLTGGEDEVQEARALERAAEFFDICAARDLPLDCSSDDIPGALAWLREEGIVKDGAVEETLLITGHDRRFLEYDKNVILGHFLADSLVATAMLSGRDGDPSGLASDVEFLRGLLEGELVFPTGDEWRRRVETSVARLDGAGEGELLLLSSLLESKLEGYLVAIETAGSIGRATPRDELVKACFKRGGTMKAEGVVRREESLSRVTFQAAVRMLTAGGLLEKCGDPVDVKNPELRLARADELCAMGVRLIELFR